MQNADYKILLVDDETDVLEFIGYNLKKEGFRVYTANSGNKAIEIAREIYPHLILLDVMMPDMDGIETCEEIRKLEIGENPMVAFLTARGEDYSQIAGFSAGGDDYITKPIKPKVLISRVKALLKRTSQKEDKLAENKDAENNIIRHGDLKIDKERYMVIHEGSEISLPRKEFDLLALLVSKPDKVFSRDEIYSKVWGEDIVVGDRTIDVHIRKLREKIGDQYFQTIKGVGYKFISK